MTVLNTLHTFFRESSKRRGQNKAMRRGYSRSLRFEGLEPRQVLSITPGDFPIIGEDTLTADMLAIDPADGPEIPPFPAGLEGQIQPTLWRAVSG